MTKAERAKRKRQRVAKLRNSRPEVRLQIRKATAAAQQRLREAIALIRKEQRENAVAPALHRRVPGLTAPRTRTVRINGFPLTLVETP